MRSYLTIFIIFIALIISCSTPEESARSSMEKGINTFKAGNPDKALETFDAIAEKYPDLPYGIFGRAVFYNREGLLYKAIDACEKAIVKDTTYLPALLLYAELASKIERPELAFFYITYYLEGGGDMATGIGIESASLLQAGKINDALNSVERGLKELPDDPLLRVMRALCYLRLGDFENGIKECTFAASKAGGNSEVYETIGDCYKLLGLYDSSAYYYNEALENNKGDVYYISDIAEKFVELEYFPRARQLLNEFKGKIPDSHRYYYISADIFARAGRMRRAMFEYGMIIQKYNQTPFVLCTFAEYKGKLRDKMGSQQYFETTRIFTRRDKYPEAASFDISFRYVEMLIEALRIDLAGPVMEDLIDTLPNNFRALQAATFLYWARKVNPELKGTIKKIQEVAAGNPANLARLGRLFVRIDSLELAHKAIADVLQIDKINHDAILAEIELLVKQKRSNEALAFINNLDEYISYNPDVARKKLELYQELGDDKTALLFAEQLINIAPGSIGRYEQTIEIAKKLDQDNKAAEICFLCTENNPNVPDAIFLYAQYLFDSKDYTKADEYIEKTLAIDSLHINTLDLKGDLLAAKGEIDSAIVIYEKVINLDKYASDALGGLALLLAESKTRLPFAENYANKAIYYDPENPDHRYALARSQYEQGRYATACVSYNNTLRFAPENSKYNYFAAINFLKADQPKSAKECFQRALKFGLTGEYKKDAEQMLKKL